MALTDFTVKGLKPEAVRYLRSDGQGLYVEVLPSGQKSFIYRYRLAGKPEKISLGRYPSMSVKLARDERDGMKLLVRAGVSPVERRRQTRTRSLTQPTLREFGERYFREYVLRNWKNTDGIRRYLDHEIYPALGERALREISALDVQTLVYRKRDNGHVAAAMKIRGVLKAIFDYAIETRVSTMNPAAMVATRFIGKTRRRARVLSEKEIRTYLLTVYKSNIRRQFKLALHIILLTLVRKSELLLARWENVDFDAGEWLIPAEDSKNGRQHVVYMSRQVTEMFHELQQLAGTSELVLPGRGSTKRPFSKNALNKALEGLTFQMEPFTIHDLRRTGATLLTEWGYDKDIIEKVLNHERHGIRAVYVHAEFAAERRIMLQQWADDVDALVNGSKVLGASFGPKS